MPPSEELKTKLQNCEPEVQQFVAQLQLENAKAQKRIAQLEAQKISNENRIAALQKELSHYCEAFDHMKKQEVISHADLNAWIESLPKA
ncbi:MAG: hypothetical protein ACOZE5_12495 [Verrucomicrobiota bacterium]